MLSSFLISAISIFIAHQNLIPGCLGLSNCIQRPPIFHQYSNSYSASILDQCLSNPSIPCPHTIYTYIYIYNCLLAVVLQPKCAIKFCFCYNSTFHLLSLLPDKTLLLGISVVCLVKILKQVAKCLIPNFSEKLLASLK